MQKSIKKCLQCGRSQGLMIKDAVHYLQSKCCKNEIQIKILKGKFAGHGDPYQSNKSFKKYFGFKMIAMQKTEEKTDLKASFPCLC